MNENNTNNVNDSILDSIKKLLGIASDYTNFDTDIIIYINSAFMVLNQLGVGPEEGFKITGKDLTTKAYVDNLVGDIESILTTLDVGGGV